MRRATGPQDAVSSGCTPTDRRPLIEINALLRYVFSFALGLLLSGNAAAQLAHQRILPTQGKQAALGEPLPLPMVQLGKEMLRMAPGGVIYDASNRAILHSALPPHAAVLYTVDANGDVQRLYVLTPTERAMLDARSAR